jgi:hypothetical protein
VRSAFTTTTEVSGRLDHAVEFTALSAEERDATL